MARKEKSVHGVNQVFPKKGYPGTPPPASGKGRYDPDHKKKLIDREATLIFQRVAITVIVTLSLYIIGFSYVWVLAVAFILYGMFWVGSVRSKKRALAFHLNSMEMIPVGTYISGFTRVRQSLLGIECFIVESDFVFVSQDGEEMGRIPRDAVNRVGVKEGDKVLQHLPFLRMLTRALNSLTGRKEKGEKPYHLLIDWKTEQGIRQYTVFEFAGFRASRDAYQAVNVIYRHLKPKRS